jgi:hypothetical protein
MPEAAAVGAKNLTNDSSCLVSLTHQRQLPVVNLVLNCS